MARENDRAGRDTGGPSRPGNGPRRPGSGPRAVGDLVGEFLDRHGLDEEVARQKATEDWPDVVGPRIAEATEPRSVSNGVLFVAVRSSAWLMELNMMKHEILQRLNDGKPAEHQVDRIVFVQGTAERKGSEPPY